MEQYSDNWQHVLILSGIAIIAVLILYYIIILSIRRFSRRKDIKLDHHIHRKFKSPLLILLLSTTFSIILTITGVENDITGHLNHLVNLVIIFSFSWLAIRSIGLGKELILQRYDYYGKDNLKARTVFTQFNIMERIMIAVVVIIAVIIALMTFESIRKIGVSLFASAGVAGIILGFAAQKLIGNVLAGFQIAVAQPIRLDDVVIVEGEWGKIEEITLTYVVIRIWDKRRLIVPTTWFIEKPFQNWTRQSAEIMGTVFIYTDYNVPFDKLREELTRVLKTDDNWDGNVNILQVTNATEKTVEVRALMSSHDSSAAWDLRVHVREKLIEYLQKNYPDSLPRTRLVIEGEGKEKGEERKED